MHRADAVVLLLIATSAVTACGPVVAVPGAFASPTFVFEDADRFRQVAARLSSVTDTVSLLDTGYLARGSAGLRAYRTRYPLSAHGLLAAIREFRDDYSSIGDRVEWLRARKDSLARVVSRYRELVPTAVVLPVYFLVGEHHGVNSGSEAGPLLSVENGAARVSRPTVYELLAHEMTHIQQFSAVGLARYRELYASRPSLLGGVVREGIAEFVAELVVGRVTQAAAQAYFREREEQVWRDFLGELCRKDNGDWMGGRPSDPQKPSSVGYALGAAIARRFYATSVDKAAALKELLGSDDYASILLRSGYAESRGTARGDLEARVRACGENTPRAADTVSTSPPAARSGQSTNAHNSSLLRLSSAPGAASRYRSPDTSRMSSAPIGSARGQSSRCV